MTFSMKSSLWGVILFLNTNNLNLILKYSKLKHVNLVRLHGITVSPLQMVLEYVPQSDLNELIQAQEKVSLKWKLKLAIDCACGIRYGSSNFLLNENINN